MKKFGLNPLKSGYGNFYKSRQYPNVYNEFATAAFKLINYFSDKFDFSQTPVPGIDLIFDYSDSLWRQDWSYKCLELFMKALVEQNSLGGGFLVSKSVQDEWRVSPSDGLNSLSALLIQQSRDHTFKSYLTYRNLAGGYVAGEDTSDWDDLTNIESAVRQSLQSVYLHVEDIDLLIGLLAETPIPDAATGKTQGHIIAQQFSQLKFSDKYYFENGEDYKNRFTEDQLDSIRSYTISKLQCNNIKNPASPFVGSPVDFTKNGFLVKNANIPGSPLNSAIECQSLPDLDLDLWKEFVSYY
jgi:hypothetical protein